MTTPVLLILIPEGVFNTVVHPLPHSLVNSSDSRPKEWRAQDGLDDGRSIRNQMEH